MVYCHNRLGYGIVCSEATVTVAVGSQGGVGIISREWPEGLIFKSTLSHGPKVVNFKLVAGI